MSLGYGRKPHPWSLLLGCDKTAIAALNYHREKQNQTRIFALDRNIAASLSLKIRTNVLHGRAVNTGEQLTPKHSKCDYNFIPQKSYPIRIYSWNRLIKEGFPVYWWILSCNSPNKHIFHAEDQNYYVIYCSVIKIVPKGLEIERGCFW